MKLKLLPLILLAFLWRGQGGASSPDKISFGVSTFAFDATYSNFLALSGHSTEGDSFSALNTIMPAGACTLLTLFTFDPGSPGWTRIATLFKNDSPTAATCTVPNGSATCVWTGSVTFAEGDLAAIRITGGGGILIEAPWSIFTEFTIGADDWPWNV